MAFKKLSRSSIILFVFFIFSKAEAQIDSSVSIRKLVQSSDEFFNKNLQQNKNIVGISAAIIVNDSVIWSNGFGYADKFNNVPMTTNTIVNMGSITKTFTSLSVMQLQQRGSLNINDPLNSYLTDFRPKTKNIDIKDITVRSVLTHTSGIQPDIWKNSDLKSGKYTDVLGYINDTYITYPPGMVGLYSNAGYNILGTLVKTVSKQDYAAYVHQNIFAPLGMSQSGFAMDGLKYRSKIYLGGNEVEEYELRDIASGGIYTNINDFSKYAIELMKAYNGESSSIIDSPTIREMFSLQNQNVPIESNKKGLGWFMFKNDSNFAVYHAGSAGFAQAKLLLIPKSKFAVIVMTNSAEGGAIAEEFCFSFLKKYQLSITDLFPAPITGKIHSSSTPIKLSRHSLKRYLGNYAQEEGYIKVILEKDRLRLIDGERQYFLTPLSRDEFLPTEIFPNDSLAERSNKRFVFKKINNENFLFQRIGDREYESGLKLKNVDRSVWENKTGKYRHFGYQMLIGDTKFKEAEIYISEDNVLMMKLTTFGSVRHIPLRIITHDHAVTCGINAGFGGFNVSFFEKDDQKVVDFAGLTFRKDR
ncbi:serine hydrolase domain-containing protein [Epilithonimonas arachidiradicis]|uniref:CubicO group peptidase (Beta-lactamase class C family) n=1 Tax=Epilithonimonas arachidiradicis TaxID=1617282 RepID=A0A420D9B2_9FLAO|nr:serine hydrolase domain-containing protein [Epilithonimonas arachidiradicis]RKE87236.1 CubicO group peptidase (beta-lactamase class C family) [Epilithonimonas arachidiradicis]